MPCSLCDGIDSFAYVRVDSAAYKAYVHVCAHIKLARASCLYDKQPCIGLPVAAQYAYVICVKLLKMRDVHGILAKLAVYKI